MLKKTSLLLKLLAQYAKNLLAQLIMDYGTLISIIVFLVVFVAITFELVNKAVAAFSGVALLILMHVIDEHLSLIHI